MRKYGRLKGDRCGLDAAGWSLFDGASLIEPLSDVTAKYKLLYHPDNSQAL